ncbi:TRAP transporter small permease [Photobacterium minamisatsumaniensis]|uniref:TRAP transporter small permease n=1 Tax=Photobacterium minamisatsumaniensis TaxID=2910233 RepID=UPI003D0A1F7A
MIQNFRRYLDNTVLFTCSFALILLVITVSWQVFSRYVLNDPSSFTDELSRFTMIWLGLLGATYLFGKKGHLSITLLQDALPKKAKLFLQTLINILMLSFIYMAMFKGGIMLIGRTLQQLSPALQIPMGYVYTILPISAVISAIYIIINIIDHIYETTLKEE